MADLNAPVPVGTAGDFKGRLRTVRRDGDQVVVPAGRYDVTGLTELINVLFDARGQLWVPETGLNPPERRST